MIKQIILDTFNSVFKNSKALTQKLLIPIALISILTYFMPEIINDKTLDFKDFSFSFDKILIPAIFAFLLIMINLSILVTTHRIMILGEDSVGKFGSYIFAPREFKVLLKTILMIIIIAIPIIALAFIPYVGIILSLIFAFILICRLSFVFPAISSDKNMSFLESWNYTKGHTLLTIFTVILFPLVFSVIVSFVYSFAIEFLIKIVSSHFIILYSILNVFITVFTISALSSAYLLIKPKPLNKFKKVIKKANKEIEQKSRKDLHSIKIHEEYDVNFDSLKKELSSQYSILGFNYTAYDRLASWILKKNENTEEYISLRYENNYFIIEANKTQKPIIELIKTIN